LLLQRVHNAFGKVGAHFTPERPVLDFSRKSSRRRSSRPGRITPGHKHGIYVPSVVDQFDLRICPQQVQAVATSAYRNRFMLQQKPFCSGWPQVRAGSSLTCLGLMYMPCGSRRVPAELLQQKVLLLEHQIGRGLGLSGHLGICW